MEEFVSKIQIAADAGSLELLQAVYRSPYVPLGTRMRAAMAALPFEHPKLAVMAMMPASEGFADKLERAVARSAKILELRPQAAIEAQPQPMRRI
jgi:hypothetical protein